MKRHLLAGVLIFGLLFTAIAQGEETVAPEEPDYAFVTGSPYTENKNFLQIILTNAFTDQLDAGIRDLQLSNSLRFEFGFTDRLEADLVVNFNDLWSRSPGLNSTANGFGDTVLGLRYRILTEAHSPITLTFGPQLLLPTGSFAKGFSPGGFGIAWDLTMAKEWNSWFFHYVSVNYATTFGARDPTPGSQALFTLHNVNWGVALGFRPLEKPTGNGGKHDLHITLEGSGNLAQEVVTGPSRGSRATSAPVNLVPGIRYGYITPHKTLYEVGVAGIIGLTSAAPDWGVILQTQWELGF